MIHQVLEFHKKFGLPDGAKNILMGSNSAIEFRVGFLLEETRELEDALYEGDRVKAFDALIDLVYVAYGTALFLGVTPEQWVAGMDAVHACNMAKVRASAPSESKRGTSLDVVKPRGWVGPEQALGDILSCKNNEAAR